MFRTGLVCLSCAGLVLTLAAAAAVTADWPTRPLHTYSIVARDPATGEMGVAVQSHWFSVGALVPWAEAGVGVVATQSFVEAGYGPRGLGLMRSGLAAPAALDALLTADPAKDVRQVAFLDAKGNLKAHTGRRCIASAGHHEGAGYSVQANMMQSGRVIPAMAKAFEASSGPLAGRLLAALEAAEAAGGDIRGRQSAALIVVRAESTGRPWADRLVDLRVEDHEWPLLELKRLLRVHQAYEEMNLGDLAVEKSDLAGAQQHYSAAAGILPDNLEIRYWQAVTLATNGHLETAAPIFRDVFARDPNWIELTRRLPPSGVIPDTPEGQALVQKILELAAPRPDP